MQLYNKPADQRSIDLSGSAFSSRRLLDKLEGITLGHYPLKPARYDQFMQVCKDFKVGPMVPYFTTYVHDADGDEICSYSRFSQSFVKGMGAIMECQLEQPVGFINATDTGGSSRSIVANVVGLAVNSGSAATLFGTVWGTGTNAVTTGDTSLQTLIAHGTGAGQLSYGSVAVGGYTASASQTTVTITRSATNSSGSTITTQEIGVYAKEYSVPYYFCIIRDLNTQAVLNTQTITTVYTLAFLL
jgi:hypothetical protein